MKDLLAFVKWEKIKVKSVIVVCFHAVTHIQPKAAHALFHPARNWVF